VSFARQKEPREPRCHPPKPLLAAMAGHVKKETVLDLGKFIDKSVRVKLSGGREVIGTLKGYDQLLNLVLDETTEFLRDPEDPLRITDTKRTLGLTVCRGTAVMVVSPTDGTDEITNPFMAQEEI
jgi:U6 snRNA-associated Sm-like protein LSm7